MGWLSFKVWILTLLTLGIYRFWGKTEVRRRLWNAVLLNNQPLEYTGTGWELFLGFIIVLIVIFLPVMALFFALAIYFGPDSPMVNIALIPVYVFFFYLTGVAVYRATRYRLRRTRWRGIRGTMTGNPWAYGWTYFWTTLTLPFTLGWSYPWRKVKLARMLVDDSHFGTQPFRLDASWKPLLRPFAAAWLVSAAALGILLLLPLAKEASLIGASQTKEMAPYVIIGFIVLLLASAYFWLRFQASSMNYLTGQTSFGSAGFRLDVTPGGLFMLMLTNLLIVIFTVGIFAPVTLARAMRYVMERMEITGAVDLAAIAQATDSIEGMGEGLADAFDIDAF